MNSTGQQMMRKKKTNNFYEVMATYIAITFYYSGGVMMKKDNRTCACCSVKYTYCNTCEGQKNEPAWKAVWCSENCKNIFMAVTDYLAKEINKSEAKHILEKCDLSNKNSFDKPIVDAINTICATKSSPKTEDIT